MADSIEIVNMLTKEEAQKKYDEFLADVKENNRKCTLLLISIIIIAIFAEVILYHFLNGGWRSGTMFIVGFAAALMCNGILESFESTYKLLWPPVYTYHQILSKYKILKTNIRIRDDGCYDVVFDAADENNEVVHKWICGFKKVIKTDVDKTTVDLVKRKVYEPYIN